MGQILIIDDELAFRRVIAEALGRKGHKTHEAGNTAEGFALAVDLTPDLIISDVCMEGGDGLTLLKRIRTDSRTSTIPFVVMTGHPDFEGMLLGAELAADGYLPKPFKLQTLLATVEQRLDRERMLRGNAEEVKEQLQRILQASPDLIGIIDPKEFNFLFLNAAGRKLLGLTEQQDASSIRLQDLHGVEAASLVQKVAIPTALWKGIWAGENSLLTADGRTIPVKQFFQAHRDPQGNIAFISTIAHDVSESKQSEAALRASEAKFRSLVDSLPEAVVMHDQQGQIVFSNARTEELFGYAPADLTGRSIRSVLGDPAVAASAEATQVHSHFETTCRRKTGEEFPADLVVNELEINGERARLNIIRDLSDRKKLERERQIIELQLRQALKLESIGQLAAGIAHEINTPTQYIGDNARFLQDAFGSLSKLLPQYQKLIEAAKAGAVTPALLKEIEEGESAADVTYLINEIPQAIQQSLEGVDRVTKIVRAMKDFSHPGVTEKVMIDINHAIESTVTVARNEWKYVANLETNLDRTLPLVPCLPGELNQVILNIVINAAHAIADVVGDGSSEKGTITVATCRIENEVQITIADTGGGIPEQIRGRIFEPFFTTKEVGKGTGQGLAISRSVVVDKHGGSIGFQSEMGKGTKFIIRLPLAQSATS